MVVFGLKIIGISEYDPNLHKLPTALQDIERGMIVAIDLSPDDGQWIVTLADSVVSGNKAYYGMAIQDCKQDEPCKVAAQGFVMGSIVNLPKLWVIE